MSGPSRELATRTTTETHPPRACTACHCPPLSQPARTFGSASTPATATTTAVPPKNRKRTFPVRMPWNRFVIFL